MCETVYMSTDENTVYMLTGGQTTPMQMFKDENTLLLVEVSLRKREEIV